ncbi:hypothetical protein DPMN_126584 [Dreissena polymorpha]|uniref:Uncharacterized protein n=1 Tax=Dreissena polymorpha TaxID=45954 RepID=A0A9D4GW00_DREPO|nr:hypothetical protein DPMN_126584 [Dreissena polymorpha]
MSNVDIRAGSTFTPTRYSILVPNVDFSAGSTFAPARYSGLMSNIDVRAASIFLPARYSGLVSNVDVRASSNSPHLDIRDLCRMSMSLLARHLLQLDILD